MIRARLLAALLLLSDCSWAVDPVTEPGQKFLEDQRRQNELNNLQQRQDAFQKPPENRDIPVEASCFPVNEILISGNTILSRSDITEVVSRYRTRCLGKDGINQLMQELTAEYIDQGYITSRVYIPPQDLRRGTLELIVIEGYVEAISINNNHQDDRDKLWWAMSPSWGKHLRLPEIEQALDQINRVPSANATMKLWPGQKTGATHVQILNSVDDELRGSVSVSNDGQENTGRNKTRLGIEADNILGINDSASLNLISSTNTNAVTLNAGVPFRWWNFDVSHSYSEYLNVLPENTDLFGQSNTSAMNVAYLAFRDSRSRLTVKSSVTVRRSERHILGVKLTPQKLVPIRLAANYSSNNSWGFFSAELAHIHGTGLFGATHDSPSASGHTPLARFQKQDVRLTLGAPLSRFGSLQTTIAGQYTDDSLYSSEQIHLGDAASVRGSDTTFASGDRGFYIQNTLNFPGRNIASLFGVDVPVLSGVSARVFSDYGRVRNLAASGNIEGTGIGAGIRIVYQHFNADLWWARLAQSRREYAGQNVFSFNLGLKVF